MIALAGLIFFPLPIILGVGAILIFGHNLLDNIHFTGDHLKAQVWGLLHDPKPIQFFGKKGVSGYPILPWIGIMALGYGLGGLYIKSIATMKRSKILIMFGLLSVLLFIVIRSINIYGDPKPWSGQTTPGFTFLSFLNLTKYPPSLLFILITLGPAMIFLALTEKPLSKLTNIISTFGRVPLFYYMAHLYLIHLLAMLAAELTGFGWSSMVLSVWITDNPALDGYGFSLLTTYLIWIGIVVSLYPICRRYDRYKTANKHKWWLSYL